MRIHKYGLEKIFQHNSFLKVLYCKFTYPELTPSWIEHRCTIDIFLFECPICIEHTICDSKEIHADKDTVQLGFNSFIPCDRFGYQLQNDDIKTSTLDTIILNQENNLKGELFAVCLM